MIKYYIILSTLNYENTSGHIEKSFSTTFADSRPDQFVKKNEIKTHRTPQI